MPHNTVGDEMSARPNVVLVHGSWADGSSWSAVIERLQAGGYDVTAHSSRLGRRRTTSRGCARCSPDRTAPRLSPVTSIAVRS